MGVEDEAVFHRRDSGLLSAAVDEELLMMSVDQGRYFNLNGVGARIWELLAEPVTLTQLVDALVEDYAVEAEAARGEVEAFLADLRARGLLSDMSGAA